LLDYLSAELIDSGWSLKHLHRQIVMSAAYRQSSRREQNPALEAAARLDPDNKLLWHARVRRRDGEAIRDAILQIAGALNPRPNGPSIRPELPPQLIENDHAWEPDPEASERNRRSIYLLAQRNLPYPPLVVFDQPDRTNSCSVRAVTITAPQALLRLNGEMTLTQARNFASLLLTEYGGDDPQLIRQAYLSAYSREPDERERDLADQFLRDQQRRIDQSGGPPPESLPESLPSHVGPLRAAAVVDFCLAVLNSAELLYVE
jgi:hypothetical protein